ncbi:MAG: HDOD domain-containing protein [Pirellulales bacterium]|nr:HDOD domain-containing protein [Pirellulales bacterium]
MAANDLRVLIVDDDRESLDRTQRMLRAYRRDWEMEFCLGAAAGLDSLAQKPYDAVVADLNMFGVDGAEMLGCVRDLYPDAVRLLVCPPEKSAALVKSLGVAHRYLSKPVDVGLMRESIARAAMLGRRLRKPGVKGLVSQIDKLPSLPDVYIAIVEELQREDAEVGRVSELLARDVSMTAKVLQLVNSSFFGLAVHVSDVRHAAALLGLNSLKPLVLTAGVFKQLEESRIPAELLERVMDHSLAVGALAQHIAIVEGLPRDAADNAMLAGVLHDIGKLVLSDHFGRNYALVCQAAEQSGLPLLAAEQDQLEATHADIGGYLLGLWGLPQDIVEAVAFHHDPRALDCSTFSPLTAVHVANAIVHARRDEDGQRKVDPTKFDRKHLAKLKCEHRVSAWVALAEEAVAV